MENDAGDEHAFYVGVSGSVGEGSAEVSVMALESRGSTCTTTTDHTAASTATHPPAASHTLRGPTPRR
jgi:hypothetical protein